MEPRHLRNLKTRSLVIHFIRDFFTCNNFLEVETPIRCPVIIPEAHIDPVMSDAQYLQASPELCMKRLLSQNVQKIFQICKCFRKNEQGPRHLPELTLLEWYAAGATYLDLMDHCQALVGHIAAGLGTGSILVYQGVSIDLNAPFDRITVADAFDAHGSKSLALALEDGSYDEIMGFEIEPFLGIKRPCILYDYPAPMAALAKLKPDDNTLAQRFELYAAGIELANGFTELTDPVLQRQRFLVENQIRSDRGQPGLPMPEKFLADLATMPDAAGIALGVDRLVMLFCDAATIDQVVAFPPEAL
ncbi:MAG: EF-P lysine aminoacylase GenX [Proteobacteria bacterium]|nr:EF-P lysine aminoacylase GenX [Desulfobacula sp.]MBU3952561.1 EF-P lysine aminoacylase GenX [Pseudomonadota bacterium]MBU4131432.1 EF-P lysine aminoacylase GenX [Pseudomonadota bacterium]